MSDMVWITHPGTGGVAEVPKEALPMYRQSGWDTLPAAERDAMHVASADETTAAEADMQDKARTARSENAVAPSPPTEPDTAVALADQPADEAVKDTAKDAPAGRRTKKENA